MTQIPIFYSEDQNAFQLASPSAAKPAFVVKSWLKKFGEALTVNSFAPVKARDIGWAHDTQYVYRVLTCKTENGFGTKDAAVARSLPFTVGSMVAAARHARDKGGVAVSPTSGFHHASFDHGEGFCTFNGLMVAATRLCSVEAPVGILDCDAHYGNGTDDIIKVLGYEREIFNFTKRGTAPPFANYAAQIRATLNDWTKKGVGLVLFQAGADPHINDPYGGDYTSDELRERDLLVFSLCERLKLPIAWNLAGGYQTNPAADPADFAAVIRPVLDIHDTTMEQCIAVYGGKS